MSAARPAKFDSLPNMMMGAQDYFTIDCWTLQRGDDLAAHVAHERQEDGSLMPGKIVRVYRDRKIV